MIKTINSKAQHTLKGLTILSSFIYTIGLVGSYETDRINDIQFTTQLVIMACITFTVYMMLSYINIIIADKLKETQGSPKRHIAKGFKGNNKKTNETA